MIDWNPLQSEAQLTLIDELSIEVPVLIFKHSTRCGISSTAKSRLERQWKNTGSAPVFYFLDLIAYRSLSNAVAMKYGIDHESPQALLINHGACVYSASHFGIDTQKIESLVADN